MSRTVDIKHAYAETTADEVKPGDYVLATKWRDGDPRDQWAVGFFDREEVDKFFVVDKDKRQLRANGFRAVARARAEIGRWLLENAAALERCPSVEEGRGVSLWGLLGITPQYSGGK